MDINNMDLEKHYSSDKLSKDFPPTIRIKNHDNFSCCKIIGATILNYYPESVLLFKECSFIDCDTKKVINQFPSEYEYATIANCNLINCSIQHEKAYMIDSKIL